MKKKFFAIYALVGAFIASPVFTSCVDDTESASVTAIRDAKTAELKSIAALKKAEAQAEATLAAAQIALKNAQAEAQVAAAKLTEAEAALQETQNEADAVALMVQKKEAEKELAAIQAEMERQEVAIQVALLNAQADLLEAKKQLDKATKDYSAQEKAELQTLAVKYSAAVTELLDAKKQLISLESTLAMYETGLADAKEELEKTKTNYNNKIVYAQAKIDMLKQYANYTEDIETLQAEYVKVEMAYGLANDNYNVAYNNYIKAENAVDDDKLYELEDAIYEDEFFYLINGYLYNEETEEWKWNYDVWYYVNRYLVINPQLKSVGINYEYNDISTILGQNYVFEYEKGDLRQFELEFSYAMDSYKNTIKYYEEQIKDLTTQYTAAVEATKAAKKAWDEAAAADKDAKKAEYEAALSTEVNLKSSIESYELRKENYTEYLAQMTQGLNLAKKEATLNEALQAKIKAYNDAAKAEYDVVAEAWKVKEDAQMALAEVQAVYMAIDALLNESGDIADSLEYYESEIESYKEEIAEAEKLLANYWTNNEQMSYEDLIAWQKAQIEAQKAVVAAKEVAVKDAKAALDAAMPSEETPAE